MRSPSKLEYIGAKGSVSKMDFLKSTKMGDPFGRQGVKSLWKEKSVRPPPLNPPLLLVSFNC